MIRENATVVYIQFLNVIIKLTLPPSIIYGLKRYKIRAFSQAVTEKCRFFGTGFYCNPFTQNLKAIKISTRKSKEDHIKRVNGQRKLSNAIQKLLL